MDKLAIQKKIIWLEQKIEEKYKSSVLDSYSCKFFKLL